MNVSNLRLNSPLVVGLKCNCKELVLCMRWVSKYFHCNKKCFDNELLNRKKVIEEETRCGFFQD